MASQFKNPDLLILKAAIIAETNNTFAGYRTSGATGAMAEWLNGDSNTDAWRTNVPPVEMDDAPDYVTFDSIAAGKRDSWFALLAFPRDFTRNKIRKWVTDVWGNAAQGSDNATLILQAGVIKATRGQLVFGGSSASTGMVTALKRNFTGRITNEDIVDALSAV